MAQGVILPETTVDNFFEAGNGVYASDIGDAPLPITLGETYTVVWNGVEYECTAFEYTEGSNTAQLLGNGEILDTATGADWFPDTGEPFLWAYNGVASIFYTLSTAASHTIAIYEAAQTLSVVLKDRSGADITYELPNGTIKLNTPDGTQIFTAGQAVEDVAVTLDFSGGNQTVNAPSGQLIKSAVIQKPDTLVPENIKKNENVAGIVGTFEGGGGGGDAEAMLAGLIDRTATEIVIPDGVTSIGYYAFYNCTSLTSVTIPDSVTMIDGNAFSTCTSLTSVPIGNSVTSIGGYAFYKCTGLTSVTIPDSVTSISDRVFYGCTNLASVTIGDGVTSIGDYAFYNCTSLTSVTIGNSVTSIGYAAFLNTALTSATFEDTSGWYVSTSSSGANPRYLSSSDLANTSTAATYLRSTYNTYYWFKS